MTTLFDVAEYLAEDAEDAPDRAPRDWLFRMAALVLAAQRLREAVGSKADFRHHPDDVQIKDCPVCKALAALDKLEKQC